MPNSRCDVAKEAVSEALGVVTAAMVAAAAAAAAIMVGPLSCYTTWQLQEMRRRRAMISRMTRLRRMRKRTRRRRVQRLAMPALVRCGQLHNVALSNHA